ncbi:MAG TPA: hypothetical protein VMU89_18470 [Thermomicrobiaceae bacterium]|nr:hypothetical protein [Thermomicrobiaceae bacterium]
MQLRHWLMGAAAGVLLLLGGLLAGPVASFAAAPTTATPSTTVTTPGAGSTTQPGSGTQTTAGAQHPCDRTNGG